MKRTTTAILLLAALGGCTSTSQDSDMNKKVVYDGRRQVPRPSDPSWTPNKVAAAKASGRHAGGVSAAGA